MVTGFRAAVGRREQRLQLLAVRGAAAQLAMAEQRGGGSFNGRALVECSRRSVTVRNRHPTLLGEEVGRGREVHFGLDRGGARGRCWLSPCLSEPGTPDTL